MALLASGDVPPCDLNTSAVPGLHRATAVDGDLKPAMDATIRTAEPSLNILLAMRWLC